MVFNVGEEEEEEEEEAMDGGRGGEGIRRFWIG